MNFNILEKFDNLTHITYDLFKNYVLTISANALGWITIVLLNFASVPTLLAVLTNQSDKLPPLDLMAFTWSALVTLFFKALIEKNFLYISTICIGFAGQTLLMGVILFK